MTCQEAHQLIAALRRGELDPAALNELHTHLGVCETCAEEYEDVADWLADWRPPSEQRQPPPAQASPAKTTPVTPTRRDLAAALNEAEAAILAAAEIDPTPSASPSSTDSSSASPTAPELTVSNQPTTITPPPSSCAATEASEPMPPSEQTADPTSLGFAARTKSRIDQLNSHVKRGLLIGSAGVIGVAILIIAARNSDAPPQPLRRAPELTKNINEHFQPLTGRDTRELTSLNDLAATQGVGRVDRLSQNDKHTLSQFFWREITPRPAGLYLVEQPGVRIHLEPGRRVLQIQALHGTLTAPNNQPKSGRCQGDVVVTLFQTPRNADRVVNLENDSPDIVLRLYMQEVDFDVEVGLLESQEDVRLTGPMVDFRGKGLRLSYNERFGLIERLEIFRGEQLRFKPDATRANNSVKNNADAQPGDTVKKTESESSAPAKDAVTPAQQQLVQYYRATLHDRVRITSIDTLIEANDSEVYFSLTPGDRDRMLQDLGGGSPKTTPNQPNEDAFADGEVQPSSSSHMTSAAAAIKALIDVDRIPDPPREKTLAPVAPDDVIITWQGPLIVTPVEEKPAMLSGPDDIKIVLDGQPVRITKTNKNSKDVITAAKATYLKESATFILDGGPTNSLVIDSQQMGALLTGRRLVIDQRRGRGKLEGAGQLKAIERSVVDDIAGDSSHANRAQLPRGLTVDWLDRVDLTFYHKPGKGPTSRQPQVADLQSVTMIGDVDVRHQQLELYSQTLAFALTDPALGKQSVDQIDADGGVRVWARGEKESQEITITSRSLMMELSEGSDGKVYPKRLLARDEVHAEQPDRIIDAQLLDVEMALRPKSRRRVKDMDLLENNPAPQNTEPFDPPTDNENRLALDVIRFVANQNVRIDLTDKRIAIEADRVDADVENDRLVLLGADDRFAKVMRRDGVLEGKKLIMSVSAQTVDAEGAGVIRFNIKSDETDKKANVSGESTPVYPYFEQNPNRRAVLNWRDGMHFDNLNGEAWFAGAVTADARQDNDTSFLSGNRMEMAFSSIPDAKHELNQMQRDKDAIGDAGAPMVERLGKGDVELRKVTVIGDAIFLSENWGDQVGQTLETRVRLAGPLLEFNQVSERINIVGKGQMLVQDQRPDGSASTPRRNGRRTGRSTLDSANVTGRGATLFTFERRLILDARNNDMKMEQNVRMFHRPSGKADVMEMNCGAFLADLEPLEQRGFAGWLKHRGPQPRLIAIRADRGVRIGTRKYDILTDHLQFVGATETMELIADPGYVTQIIEQGQPAPMTAKKFRWDLAKDLIEIEQPGTGKVPVR